MTENDISYRIRGCIFNVYYTLGPGLLESVYLHTLNHELQKCGLETKVEFPVPVFIRQSENGCWFLRIFVYRVWFK
jgi:GxxExxY protein